MGRSRKRTRETNANKSERTGQQLQIVEPKPDQQETLRQIRRAYYESIVRQVDAREKARTLGEA